MPKHIAVYVRVSTKRQDTESQMPDLNDWIECNAKGEDVQIYKDKASGKSMNRPAWKELESNLRRGRVSRVVVWRLDRLGRTVVGLASLFDLLRERDIPLVSIKDGLDLSTPAGSLVANVLASVAQYQREIIGENTRAGQAKARKQGKTWGGSKPGRRLRVTPERERTILTLKDEGVSVTRIAETVGVSRQTVYTVLNNAETTSASRT